MARPGGERLTRAARKVVYLVSGVGVPRDESAAPGANSTECAARLMKLWLKVTYPQLQVRRSEETKKTNMTDSSEPIHALLTPAFLFFSFLEFSTLNR